MHFESDRDCIEKLLPTCARLDVAEATIAWIPNTMDLGELMISENLLDEVRANPEIEVLSEAAPLAFDGDDNLVEVFHKASH